MAAQDPSLDEIQWRSPALLQSMNGLHSNSVLPYFSNSPFFDQTSNNAIITAQAMYNASMFYLIETREAFEGRLRSMNGLEFLVAQEPAEMAPGTGTAVWVIRKQVRRKVGAGEDDELTVLSTYFVVGENIYMAPGIGDVVGSRLLAVASSLSRFISTASTLADFTPALGRTYLPPPTRRQGSKVSSSQFTQASKESTPLPDSMPTTQSSTYASNNKLPSSTTTASSQLAARLLDESLAITLHYGEEYMDENPILGQPGEFHLSTTGRKEKDRPTAPRVPSKLSVTTSGAAEEAKTVQGAVAPAANRKGSKSDKSPKTPVGGGGTQKPKRRKSKGLTSGGGINPTT